MSRIEAKTDVFRAIADPTRRALLDRLRAGPANAGTLAADFRSSRPAVSKHLRVLRDVELVHVRRSGRHMLYRTNAEVIRPLHEWTKTFERFWQHQLLRVKERAESASKLQSD